MKTRNLTVGFLPAAVLAFLDGDLDGDAENTDFFFAGLDVDMTATIHAERRD